MFQLLHAYLQIHISYTKLSQKRQENHVMNIKCVCVCVCMHACMYVCM